MSTKINITIYKNMFFVLAILDMICYTRCIKKKTLERRKAMKNNFKDMPKETLERLLEIRKTTRNVDNPITAEEISQIEQELEKFKS